MINLKVYLYEIVEILFRKTNVIQKFTDLCEFAIKRNTNFHNYENYRVEIISIKEL